MFRSPLLSALLALSIASTSCSFRKPSRAYVPPPSLAPKKPAVKPPAPIPDPPKIDADLVTTPPPIDVTASMPPELEPPPKAKPRKPVVIATPRPAPPPTPEPVPTPKLGQMFTAEQLREYNNTLNESLERVRKALAAVSGKTLNASQADIAERIRTFQKQAEQAREQDLVTAVSLARRADLLAKDLLERLP